MHFQNIDGTEFFERSECSAKDVFRDVVVHKLGLGGVVTELLSTKVIIDTSLRNLKDRIILKGEAKEMASIVKLSAYHMLIMNNEDARRALNEAAEIYCRGIPSEHDDLLFNISLMIGKWSTIIALLSVVGARVNNIIEFFSSFSLKDMAVAAELHFETGMPFLEIIEKKKSDDE